MMKKDATVRRARRIKFAVPSRTPGFDAQIMAKKKLFVIFLTYWTWFWGTKLEHIFQSTIMVVGIFVLSEICKKHSYHSKPVGGGRFTMFSTKK